MPGGDAYLQRRAVLADGFAGQPSQQAGMAGRFGERNVPAKKPLPGAAPKDRWFSGEAWKNQAAFGRAGKRPGLPPKPRESPNGSFHRPKPQVPGRAAADRRARRLKSRGEA